MYEDNLITDVRDAFKYINCKRIQTQLALIHQQVGTPEYNKVKDTIMTRIENGLKRIKPFYISDLPLIFVYVVNLLDISKTPAYKKGETGSTDFINIITFYEKFFPDFISSKRYMKVPLIGDDNNNFSREVNKFYVESTMKQSLQIYLIPDKIYDYNYFKMSLYGTSKPSIF